jgi:hypothetical protein
MPKFYMSQGDRKALILAIIMVAIFGIVSVWGISYSTSIGIGPYAEHHMPMPVDVLQGIAVVVDEPVAMSEADARATLCTMQMFKDACRAEADGSWLKYVTLQAVRAFGPGIFLVEIIIQSDK